MSAMSRKLTAVLIGKTGNGKSSVGNTLLGQNKFEVKDSPKGVTENIQLETCKIRIGNRYLDMNVVDTPGLFECGKFVQNAMKIFDVEKMSPDVFLLVLQANGRFSEEDKLVIDMMRILLGDNVFSNTIIIVTYGDKFSNDEQLVNYLTASEDVQKVMELCGNRVMKIDNPMKNFDLEKFFRFTDEIARNATMPYKNIHSHIHREIVKTYLQQNQEGKSFRTQLQEISKLIAKRLPNWTIRLLMGSVIGGAGLVTLAYMAKPTRQ